MKKLRGSAGVLVSLSLLAMSLALGSSVFSAQPAAKDVFTDVTEAAGITWVHFNGESEDRNLIEAKNGGLAFLDFDRDGWLDIFLVNGGETPKGKSKTPVRNALYRNLGNGKFEDVAAQAGVDRLAFFGIGVSVADYDNDGFPDLFVSGYPACALFHNNGNGTFTEVAEKAGVRNFGKWSPGSGWFDYDRDRFLDLLVCQYGRMSFDSPPRCEFRGENAYCEPKAYPGEPLVLFHNNGDGTFTDVSAPSGVQKYVGRGLAMVTVDVNNDGWPDVFVARDNSPNVLLINQRDGTFQDFALDAEVAYDPNGVPKSGMGVDAGDVNGDGWPDFVLTAFEGEYHSLFINPGSFPFEDWTFRSGLSTLTASYVGWGTHFIDYDNDGVLDLIIVNGHVLMQINLMKPVVTYKEPPLLLRNDGKGVFRKINDLAGPAFHTVYDARGLAVGDFDNDGDTDVAFIRLQDRPVLLRNHVGQDNPWIGFELQGTKSNRDAIGARLTVHLGSRKLVRWITGGSSIFSAHDNRVIFGLSGGLAPGPVSVEILWPSGILQNLSRLQPNRYHKIVEETK